MKLKAWGLSIEHSQELFARLGLLKRPGELLIPSQNHDNRLKGNPHIKPQTHTLDSIYGVEDRSALSSFWYNPVAHSTGSGVSVSRIG